MNVVASSGRRLAAPRLALSAAVLTATMSLASVGTNQFNCPGSQIASLLSTPLSALSTTPGALAGLQTAAGQGTPLRFTLTLINGAPKTIQGKTTKITYTITAVPRAAKSL